MDLWKFIAESAEPAALLCVTQSTGSSPGRAGFKMAIRANGELWGSIGGGTMERRLVKWAIERLSSGNHEPILRRQIHRPGVGQDHSGLICSGEQIVALVVVSPELAKIAIEQSEGFLTLSPKGIHFSQTEPRGQFWAVEELATQDTLCIIGGGHVGLALSGTMSRLGFRIELFDDRPGLNTIEMNHFADVKHIGPLDEILPKVPRGEHVFLVAVTFGVEKDRAVLRNLSDGDFRYFGLMGSEAKLGHLKKEFGSLSKIHAPVGLPICSHTPEEIAISIAAEIIQVKNSSIDPDSTLLD